MATLAQSRLASLVRAIRTRIRADDVSTHAAALAYQLFLSTLALSLVGLALIGLAQDGLAGFEPLTRGLQAALPYVDDFLQARTLTNLVDLATHLNALASGRSSR